MTGSLTWLVLALLAFVASHMALPLAAARAALVARLGENGYLIFYSILSLALLAWVIAAYRESPTVALWAPPTALRHTALTLMLLASLLLACGYTQGNPTMLKLGRRAGAQPYGIIRVTRHPIMWAGGLWAIAHVLANGDAAGLVLFVGIGFLAIAGTTRIDRRHRRLGGEAWRALEAKTSNVPFVALVQGRAGAGLGWTLAEIGVWRLVLGVALFAGLFLAHPWLAGVPAFRP